MPSYLISPPDETAWSLSTEEFAEHMRARWPEAELRWENDSSYPAALRFVLPMADGYVSGWFDREGDGVHLEDRSLELLVEVALWFRSVAPPEQPLIFYDEGYTANVELHGDMSAEQVAERYLDLAWKAASDR